MLNLLLPLCTVAGLILGALAAAATLIVRRQVRAADVRRAAALHDYRVRELVTARRALDTLNRIAAMAEARDSIFARHDRSRATMGARRVAYLEALIAA